MALFLLADQDHPVRRRPDAESALIQYRAPRVRQLPLAGAHAWSSGVPSDGPEHKYGTVISARAFSSSDPTRTLKRACCRMDDYITVLSGCNGETWLLLTSESLPLSTRKALLPALPTVDALPCIRIKHLDAVETSVFLP